MLKDNISGPFTFKEWKAKGYHVRKGQKSTARNADGYAVFYRAQVDWTEQDEGDEDSEQYYWDTYGYDKDY